MTTHIGRTVRVVDRPGFIERALVVVFIFVNQFGTPENWFLANTGSASGVTSNPTLVGVTLLVAAVLMLGLVGNGAALIRALSASRLLTGFVLLLSISPLWSFNRPESVARVVTMLALTMFGVVLVVRFELLEILGLAALALGIGVILDTVWSLGIPTYGQSAGGQWDGLATQKNALGATSAVAAVVLYTYGKAVVRHRLFVALPFGLAVLNLIMSQSKTSLAAAGLTLASMFVFVAFRAKKTLFGAVAITLTAGSALSVLVATANLQFIANLFGKDVTLSGRTVMWSLLTSKVAERPTLGYGYGGFWQGFSGPSAVVWRTAAWAPTHAHNGILQAALDVGIVGALALTFLLLTAVVAGTHYLREVPGVLGLFPLSFISMMLLYSVSESGPLSFRFGWSLFVVAVITVGDGRLGSRLTAQPAVADRIDAPGTTSGARVLMPEMASAGAIESRTNEKAG